MAPGTRFELAHLKRDTGFYGLGSQGLRLKEFSHSISAVMWSNREIVHLATPATYICFSGGGIYLFLTFLVFQ